MVQNNQDLGKYLVIDDRVTLPPEDKMEPEFKKKCDEAYAAVARKLGWDKPSK